MKTIDLLLTVLILTFMFACGGGESQQKESSEMTEPSEMETQAQQADTMSQVRTIDIIGIDQMKFTVEEKMDGITVGDPADKDGKLMLLKTIEAMPGERIRIRLTTRTQLPPTAMAHNWILLKPNADGSAYSNKAMQAQDQDYMPSELSDQVLFHTGLASGGETTEVIITAPSEPGDYEYLCSFPGHYAAGMKGILSVKNEG